MSIEMLLQSFIGIINAELFKTVPLQKVVYLMSGKIHRSEGDPTQTREAYIKRFKTIDIKNADRSACPLLSNF